MTQTTFSVAVSGDDGWVETGFEASYPPVTATTVDTTGYVAAKKEISGGNYAIRVGLMRWDTSSLDDDTNITSAILRVYVASVFNVNNRDVTLEWYEPGVIGLSDYTSTVGTSANAGIALSTITAGPNDFNLSNIDNISRTGYTGLRMHISGVAPTGVNNIFLASIDAPEAEPQLIVDHEVSTGVYYIGGGG